MGAKISITKGLEAIKSVASGSLLATIPAKRGERVVVDNRDGAIYALHGDDPTDLANWEKVSRKTEVTLHVAATYSGSGTLLVNGVPLPLYTDTNIGWCDPSKIHFEAFNDTLFEILHGFSGNEYSGQWFRKVNNVDISTNVNQGYRKARNAYIVPDSGFTNGGQTGLLQLSGDIIDNPDQITVLL